MKGKYTVFNFLEDVATNLNALGSAPPPSLPLSRLPNFVICQGFSGERRSHSTQKRQMWKVSEKAKIQNFPRCPRKSSALKRAFVLGIMQYHSKKQC